MNSVTDIMESTKPLNRTTGTLLTREEILECDMPMVKPVGKSFVKKYHHFAYGNDGEVLCQVIKGEGDYITHQMRLVDQGMCSIILSFPTY
jgi:hypothetical protein